MQYVLYSHGGDVLAREGIGGVANQQTGLTHSPEEEGQQRIQEYTFTTQFNTLMDKKQFCTDCVLVSIHD